MAKPAFSKIEKDLSLSEKIEAQILDAIRQKIFIPGDKLVGEMELAESFGVSRTVVREALHRLAGRGVVEIRKNSGVFVSPARFSSVTDSLFHLLEIKCGESSLLNIADVRLIIEPEMARIAAENSTPEDIEKMKESYSNMENNLDDPVNMIAFDIDFHRSIAYATKNPILPVIMEPLFQLMTRFISDTYEYPQSPSLALRSHKKILEEIGGKNPEGSFHAMKAHMTEAREHALIISKKENVTNKT